MTDQPYTPEAPALPTREEVAPRPAVEAGVVEAKPGLVEQYDDGSSVVLESYSGGAHPKGAWSELSLCFIAIDGTETVRRYVALDALLKAVATETKEEAQ